MAQFSPTGTEKLLVIGTSTERPEEYDEQFFCRKEGVEFLPGSPAVKADSSCQVVGGFVDEA